MSLPTVSNQPGDLPIATPALATPSSKEAAALPSEKSAALQKSEAIRQRIFDRIKEARESNPKELHSTLMDQISREDDRGNTKGRLLLKATSDSLLDARQRIADRYKVPLERIAPFPLQRTSKGRNPNAKIATHIYLPYEMVKSEIQEKQNLALDTKAWMAHFNQLIAFVHASLQGTSLATANGYIQEFAKEFNNIKIIERTNPVRSKELLFIAAHKLIDRIDLLLSEQEFDFHQSPECLAFLQLVANIDTLTKVEPNPLYKKREVIERLRLYASALTFVSDEELAAKAAIPSEEDAKDAQDKFKNFNVHQQAALDGLNHIIQTLSTSQASYVEKSVLDNSIQKLPKKAFIKQVAKEPKYLQQDLQHRINRYINQLTAYISKAEISAPHVYQMNTSALEDITDDAMEKAILYLPRSKLERAYAQKRPRAPNPFKDLSNFYLKDDIIKAFNKKEISTDRFKSCPYFISEKDLLVLVSDISAFKANSLLLLKDLTQCVRVDSENLDQIFKAYPLEVQFIDDAIDKTDRVMEGHSVFFLKMGLENVRELLAQELFHPLGYLAHYIIPKFTFKMENISIAGETNPTVLASWQVKGSSPDKEILKKFYAIYKQSFQRKRLESKLAEKDSIRNKLVDAQQQYAQQLNINAPEDEIEKTKAQIKELGAKWVAFASYEERLKTLPTNDQIYIELSSQIASTDPRGIYSLMAIGIIDLLFGSIDSHRNQFIIDEEHGTYRHLDFARYFLHSPLYSQENQTFFPIRTFSLSHPFAHIPLPDDLVKLILSLDATSICTEWKHRGLLDNDTTTYAYLTEIVLRIDRATPKLDELFTTYTKRWEAELRTYCLQCLKKKDGISDAKQMESVKDATVVDLLKICKADVVTFFKDKLALEVVPAMAKADLEAVGHFKSNFEALQRLLKTTKAVTLVQVFLCFYGDLEPFIDAVGCMEEDPYGSYCFKDDKYRSLEDIIEQTKKFPEWFTETDTNKLRQLLAEMKSNKWKYTNFNILFNKAAAEI